MILECQYINTKIFRRTRHLSDSFWTCHNFWSHTNDFRGKEIKGADTSCPSMISPYTVIWTERQWHHRRKRRFTYVPLIVQSFRCFTYFTAHSPSLPPLHLRHSSFYNPSAASPTSQVILQPFRCFTYVTSTSRTSPGEPPMPRGMKKQSVVN